MNKRFFDPEPRIFAHRGLGAEFPENTMLSFQKAVAVGADVIETDLQITKDNRFVIVHDETLERISNGEGRIADHTLSQLQQLDTGYRFTRDNGASFPCRGTGLTFFSLEEMLTAFPEQRFNIDLKPVMPEFAGAYVDIIKRCNAVHRVLTASEHRSNLTAVRSLLPEMATSTSVFEVVGAYALFKFGFLMLKKKFQADAFQIPEFYGTSRLVTASFVRQVKLKGMRVHVWTVNSEADMHRLFDLGIDGIVSDDARIVKKVLSDMGR